MPISKADMLRSAALTISVTLIALTLPGCATPASPPAGSTAKVATASDMKQGEGFQYDNHGHVVFTPALQVGETRSGTVVDDRFHKNGTWTVELTRSDASLWHPTTWGGPYVVTLTTGVRGTYYFRDQEGGSYSLGVNRTSVSHTVRYSSDDPALTSFTLDTDVPD